MRKGREMGGEKDGKVEKKMIQEGRGRFIDPPPLNKEFNCSILA